MQHDLLELSPRSIISVEDERKRCFNCFVVMLREMDESNFLPDGWLDNDLMPEVEVVDPRVVNDVPLSLRDLQGRRKSSLSLWRKRLQLEWRIVVHLISEVQSQISNLPCCSPTMLHVCLLVIIKQYGVAKLICNITTSCACHMER